MTFYCHACGGEWEADTPLHFHACVIADDEVGSQHRSRWRGDRETSRKHLYLHERPEPLPPTTGG